MSEQDYSSQLINELRQPIMPMIEPPVKIPPSGTLPRLAGSALRGATFGMAGGVEPETIPEYLAEFIGSIPSTLGAVAVAGPAAGAIPVLRGLTGIPRAMAISGLAGTGVGTGKAITKGDLSEIPKEAAWWLGSEAAGQGVLKGIRALRKPGITPPGVTPSGVTKPTLKSLRALPPFIPPERGPIPQPPSTVLFGPKGLPEHLTVMPEQMPRNPFNDLLTKERLAEETAKIVRPLEVSYPTMMKDLEQLKNIEFQTGAPVSDIPLRDILVSTQRSGALVSSDTPLQKKIRAEIMRQSGGGEKAKSQINLDDFIEPFDPSLKIPPRSFIIEVPDPVTGTNVLKGATSDIDKIAVDIAQRMRTTKPPIAEHEIKSVEEQLVNLDVRKTGKTTPALIEISDDELGKYFKPSKPIKGGVDEAPPTLNVGKAAIIEPGPDGSLLNALLRELNLEPNDARNAFEQAVKRVDDYIKTFSRKTKRIPSVESREALLQRSLYDALGRLARTAGVDLNAKATQLGEASQLIVKGKLGQMSVHTLEEVVEGTAETFGDLGARRKMGFFFPGRTMRGAFGPEFTTNVLNPLHTGIQKIEGWLGDKIGRANEAGRWADKRWISRYSGVSREIGEEVTEILLNMGKGGVLLRPGLESTYRNGALRAARRLRELFDEAFIETGIDPDRFIQGYAPIVWKTKKGIFYKPSTEVTDPMERAFISKLKTADELVFYHELERYGDMPIERNAWNLFGIYMHNAAKAKFTKNLVTDLEKKYINDYFQIQHWMMPTGQRFVKVNSAVGYNAWNELVHTVLGGPTAMDIKLTDGMRRLSRAFGYETDLRSTYNLSHIASTMWYMGTLGAPIVGGRPASIVRQMFQLVPTYAELGGKYTIQGISNVMKDITGGGTLIKQMQESGIITSHLDNLVSSVSAGSAVGRGVSHLADNWLKNFAAVDRFARAVTAEGAKLKFDDYLSRDMIEKLSMKPELKEAVLKLHKQGKTDQARFLYQSDIVGELQYFYGKANRPEIFRGALGGLLGMFAQYPLNSMEMLYSFSRRAALGGKEVWKGNTEGYKEMLPMLRLMGLTAVLMATGEELLDADLSSAMFTASIPHSLAFPKLATDSFSAGTSTAQWALNNLFIVGVDDVQRRRMHQAWQDTGRGLANFIPLWNAAKDAQKIIDGESLAATLFALTPLPEERDKERKRRAIENRNNPGIIQETLPYVFGGTRD